jgi:predicted nucleic acid-binding protein
MTMNDNAAGATPLMLDTGVLGWVCHPRKHADVKLWLKGVFGVRRYTVLLPEIADYELRRELHWIDSKGSLARLNALPGQATYVPLDTATMQFAAELWAYLRKTGQPTEAREHLGGDVILAAQALLTGATVVTDNPKHLGRLVTAVRWQDVR